MADPHPDVPHIARWYRTYRETEAQGRSPLSAGWAAGVEADADMLALVATLPRVKRQPSLVFACARFLGAPLAPYPEFRAWVLAHSAALLAEATVRTTQANEPRRMAALLPALASISGPLALLEVGAAAGLCLYPDWARYAYTDAAGAVSEIGPPSALHLECSTTGDVPLGIPAVVWRAGVDLAPLDVRDPDDVRWLEALVPPGEDERLARVRAAAAITAADPPLLLAGDARALLPELVATAPAGSTPVLVSPAVLVYLDPAERAAFAADVAALGIRWISLDGRDVLPGMAERMPVGRDAAFVLSLDGQPVAGCDPLGASLDWW
jgi:hypothetical protein